MTEIRTQSFVILFVHCSSNEEAIKNGINAESLSPEIITESLDIELSAHGLPEGLLPRDEVVLKVGVVIAEAEGMDPLTSVGRQLLVNELGHRVEVLVRLVAEAEDGELQFWKRKGFIKWRTKVVFALPTRS